MKEYLLDEPLSAGFFEYLRYFGKVETLSALGDGYYNFTKKNWFSIKGFAGDTSVEVRFTRETMDLTTGFLRMLFSRYNPAKLDIDELKAKEKAIDVQIEKLLK